MPNMGISLAAYIPVFFLLGTSFSYQDYQPERIFQEIKQQCFTKMQFEKIFSSVVMASTEEGYLPSYLESLPKATKHIFITLRAYTFSSILNLTGIQFLPNLESLWLTHGDNVSVVVVLHDLPLLSSNHYASLSSLECYNAKGAQYVATNNCILLKVLVYHFFSSLPE